MPSESTNFSWTALRQQHQSFARRLCRKKGWPHQRVFILFWSSMEGQIPLSLCCVCGMLPWITSPCETQHHPRWTKPELQDWALIFGVVLRYKEPKWNKPHPHIFSRPDLWIFHLPNPPWFRQSYYSSPQPRRRCHHVHQVFHQVLWALSFVEKGPAVSAWLQLLLPQITKT